MSRFVGVLLTLQMAAGSCLGATWYVDVAATGSAQGTNWANAWTACDQINWKSIQPGDTVLFAKGDYSATSLTLAVSGTSNAPIMVAIAQDPAHNGLVWLTNAAGVVMNRNWVILNGALNWDYPTNNLVISNLWRATNNMGFMISGKDNAGITCSAGKGNAIQWCNIYNCGAPQKGNHGIRFNGNDPGPATIAYCWSHGNRGNGVSIANNATQQLNDIVIHHCLFTGNFVDGVGSPGGITIAWCIIREFGYVLGPHSDIWQTWNGAGNNGGNILFHHNSVGDVVSTNGQYGSWGYIQWSGDLSTNVYIYDNLFYNTSFTPPNATAAAPMGMTCDGFYDNFHDMVLRNFFFFNNLFRGPKQQALNFVQQEGVDWRGPRHQTRGFVHSLTFANIYVANNEFVDLYSDYPGSPVFAVRPTTARSYFFPAGTNIDTGAIYPDTNVTATTVYNTQSFRFLNNVVCGVNTAILLISSNAFATPEGLDAATGYSGNTSARPSFAGYDQKNNFNFRLASADKVARNTGLNPTTFASLPTNLPDLFLDIDGRPRPSSGPWDRGPYQSSGSATNASLSPPSGLHIYQTDAAINGYSRPIPSEVRLRLEP